MEKLLLIDTSAIMYRAYYAMQYLKNSEGFYTGAIFGFTRQLESCIDSIKPKYIAAAYDIKRKNLNRTKLFKDYKANRKSMPLELVNQVDVIKDIIAAYNIPSFSMDGYEADDVIGSLANFAINKNVEVHIITGDKDIQQLITDDENIHIHYFNKEEVSKNRIDVKNNIGVFPEQIPDYFGLIGDKSDGILGVNGIGEKKGIRLINLYDNLDNLYDHIDELKGKEKENLINDKEMAFLSKELATIVTDIDFKISLDDLLLKEKDSKTLYNIFKKYELNSLLSFLDTKEVEVTTIKKDIDFIKKFLKENKDVLLHIDDNFIACCNSSSVYVFDLPSDDNLFSKKPDFSSFEIDKSILVYDAKNLLHKGFVFKDFFDILIASYIINTESNLEAIDIAQKYSNVTSKKYSKIELRKITIDELRDNFARLCYGLYKSSFKIKEKLKEIDVMNSYEKIEKPLINVLYEMEKKGIKISKESFKNLEDKFSKLLKTEEDLIYELALEKFNIDSPKQLATILFEKLQIEAVKKTKSGFSTDASVLEELSLRGIEIAKHLLLYRSYKKLLSTYIEPLPLFADENSRIHSSFNATGTATGRLSSQNPNLQNIPTRTEEGQLIRNCFIASEGKKLVSFDYSQIELRVLAELSKDETLINAYTNDLDLHKETAKKLFHKEDIDKIERNIAKTINFSVLYGKTPFGLSKELKISVSDAKKYIDTYFEEYKKVPLFIEKIIQDCKKNLYVETLFGTRRYIHDITSVNKITFEQAKRMAINTVIQGTAANIIKLVMIKLSEYGFNMLVQVHDELIFELDEKTVLKEVEVIKDIMENTIKFENVKLKVNYEIADKWGDLK